jgi:ssDNA thymidine ADP-ribosyltransferase DarT-like protein
MVELTQARGRIFRITHVKNVAWLLANGLHCRRSEHRDPGFVQIGNPDLISKRGTRVVPLEPGGTLDDYLPFYFTPFSPMLYNIKTGYNGIQQRPMSDIVILTSSLPHLLNTGAAFVFTDRHAYLRTAVFKRDLADLAVIDWKRLQDRDFKHDPNDPAKFERYQAEALVYRQAPITALSGIVCYTEEVKQQLEVLVAEQDAAIPIAAQPAWFFQ